MALPTLFLPTGTASYAWISKPDDKFNKEKPDYKITVILDEDSDEVKALLEDIKRLGKEAAKKEGVKLKKNFKMPFEFGNDKNAELVDDDKDAKPEWEDKILITAKSKYQPKVFYASADLAEQGAAPMSGDEVKVKVQINPYDGFGSGISLRLKAVKLIEKNSDFDNEDFGDGEDNFTATPKDEAAEEEDEDDEDF